MFNRTIIVAFALAASVICFVNMAQSQGYVTDGLIGFWTMDAEDIQDKSVKDVSGNNNHAEMGGDPGMVAGKIEGALHFDGVDDFVALPDLGSEPSVTVEVWANMDEVDRGTADRRPLVSLFGADLWKPGTIHFKFTNENDAKYLIWALKNDGGDLRFPMDRGKWFHAAYTCDIEKDEFKLYVNAELVAEGKAGTTPDNLTALRLASEYNGRYGLGIIDEVRVYGRVLDLAEIQRNYKVESNDLAVRPVGRLSICWGEIKNSG